MENPPFSHQNCHGTAITARHEDLVAKYQFKNLRHFIFFAYKHILVPHNAHQYLEKDFFIMLSDFTNKSRKRSRNAEIRK